MIQKFILIYASRIIKDLVFKLNHELSAKKETIIVMYAVLLMLTATPLVDDAMIQYCCTTREFKERYIKVARPLSGIPSFANSVVAESRIEYADTPKILNSYIRLMSLMLMSFAVVALASGSFISFDVVGSAKFSLNMRESIVDRYIL
ncbi:MAG: hypothetical protein EZS28_023406 [Streblomastix strix]|uniref:Uncharacterized protein n=1 Tax=Streblomastix strix TaxID=222440 RepID=A0A5J4VF97_9EUKA|nr:MAG: hypothetical protein EZS28_023406 [Streblomastix strix]